MTVTSHWVDCENTIDSMSKLRAQSLQEKFHHRLAACLRYQPHKVTSITKSLSFHIHFTVYVYIFLIHALL